MQNTAAAEQARSAERPSSAASRISTPSAPARRSKRRSLRARQGRRQGHGCLVGRRDQADQARTGATDRGAPRTAWTQASERNKVERAAQELAARVDAAKQRFGNEIKAGRFDRARSTLVELQTIAAKDDVFVRDAPATLADALARRIDVLLSSPEAIDRAALSSLVGMYRATAPESYRSRTPAWLATIKRRLADLAADPAAHNAYLAAVQGALVDSPGVASAASGRTKTGAIGVEATGCRARARADFDIHCSTSAPSNGSVASNGSATVAPAVQPPAAAAPAAEPNLLGKWCGEGLGLAFAANKYSFDLGGGRTIKYPVVSYQRAGDVVTMSWTDKNLGQMVTEFGEFSADGQNMVHLRGKTAASAQWQTYNRTFRRCK